MADESKEARIVTNAKILPVTTYDIRKSFFVCAQNAISDKHYQAAISVYVIPYIVYLFHDDSHVVGSAVTSLANIVQVPRRLLMMKKCSSVYFTFTPSLSLSEGGRLRRRMPLGTTLLAATLISIR